MIVHEATPDGRFVVTNSCRFDIPTETNFLVLFAERGVIESGGNYRVAEREPMTTISLRLTDIEFFRRSVDQVPYGHHAGVRLVGSDAETLSNYLASHPTPWHVSILSSLKEDTGRALTPTEP